MTYPAWNPHKTQRVKRRMVRRCVRNSVVILSMVFGSVVIAVLAWLVFVMPYV